MDFVESVEKSSIALANNESNINNINAKELDSDPQTGSPGCRKAPEGRDNDYLENSELIESKNEATYTTDVNGKVTVVHVVVTINGNGTLADLKKQRMQIRNSTGDINSLHSPLASDCEAVPKLSPNDIIRFTGDTDEIVGYSKSKRCCSIQ